MVADKLTHGAGCDYLSDAPTSRDTILLLELLTSMSLELNDANGSHVADPQHMFFKIFWSIAFLRRSVK